MKQQTGKWILLTAALSLGTVACASSGRDYARSADAQASRADTAFISAENVNEAKRVLKSQGYDPGPMNGQMDARTKEALKRFQDFNNIQQTGILDRPTVSHLEQRGAHFTGTLGAIRQDDRVNPGGYIP